VSYSDFGEQLWEAAASWLANALEALNLLNNNLKNTSILPAASPPYLTMPATTAETLSFVSRNVSVAPLVLLSAADHYGRSAKGTRKRVVGVLLGQNDGKNVRVSNSFAGGLPPQLQLSGAGESFTVDTNVQQYLSKRMTRTLQYGFWITTTSSR